MGNFPMIILLVVMIGMFFMMNRGQKKEQQKRQNLLDSMKPGDSVVTIGGLHGVVSEMNSAEKTVTLDCEGIFLVFDRASIRTVKPATPVNPAPVEEAEVVEPEMIDPEPTEKED
ncbi:preprotein translocase subunit YajC [Enterococcus sp. AZ109]|uniref:preprotein translocase subunit YajC n=1 Tax=Enterococcus sp. AZ109 TaxID=2774634 RepID=UPI003F2705B4